MKNNKAAGIDDVVVEHLKNHGAKNSQVAACNTHQLIHLVQGPNNMEENRRFNNYLV